MVELSKRLVTSFLLLSFVALSLINNVILFILLIFFLYQLIFEFNFIFKKIFNKKKIYHLVFQFLSIIYITFIVIKLWTIFTGNNDTNKLYIYIIFLICIFSDIGGFIFGKTFRGKKLTKISPNKTISGMIGSFILSMTVVVIYSQKYFEITNIIIFTILISFISQIGDLIISYLKRKAQIKDTGNILPGHGGALDRLDGLIFAIPLGLFLKNLL
tara:strand:- start:1006 stop:1650 length:645 start_codon:yes stop_codon:yes gene_type:complete